MKLSIRLGSLLAAGALAVAGLAACAPDNSNDPNQPNTGQTSWPLTFQNADGTTTEIPSQPQRVLSTTVSTTGTLLAIDAPVVASASAGNGQFFAQWASVAEERKVENVWAAGSVDIEAAIAATPDLIVVSTSGADSALDQLAEFQSIAPTIVINYADQTWQDLAAQLGTALGTSDKVAGKINEFNTFLTDSAAKIQVPAGSVNIISYNGAGNNNPIAKGTGPHAQLLSALGFTLEEPKEEWHTQAGQRADFVWASFENLTELTAETTFLLSVGDEKAKEFIAEPVLANLPSVKNGQVYGLGANSFRIDLYSSTEIVNDIVTRFAK